MSAAPIQSASSVPPGPPVPAGVPPLLAWLSTTYGAWAFGLITFLAVWFAVVKPLSQQISVMAENQTKQTSAIEALTVEIRQLRESHK